MSFIPPLPVIVPLAVAAVIGASASRLPRRVAESLAIATSVACICWSVILLMRVSGGRSIYWFAGWHPTGRVALGVSFSIDTASAVFAALASVLMLGAFVYAIHYFEETLEHRFQILMLVFLGALNGFFLTGDMFNMFVFFELMSVAAYSLTGYKIDESAPLQGGLAFAITNSLGAFTFLIGIALVYARTGALNLAQIGESLSRHPADALVVAAVTFIICGLFVKAAIVPFHFWLADAHAVAPTPVCVMFSGIMVEAGLYGAIRVLWIVFGGVLGPSIESVGHLFVALGCVTTLIGAVMCFVQQHLKRLLAYSTISHVGIFLVGAGTLDHVGLAGMGIYVVTHGLAKGALFMAAGIVLHRLGQLDDSALLGQGRHLRGAGLLFLIGGLAIAGMPPFGTFLGKALIEDAAISQHMEWLPWLVAVASALTGGAVLRAAGRIFMGWGAPENDRFNADRVGQEEDERESSRGLDRTPATMLLPATILLLGSLVVGVLPEVTRLAEGASAQFLDRHGYEAAVLAGHALAVIKPEPTATSTGAYVFGAATTALAVLLALLSLFRQKISEPIRLSIGRTLSVPVDAIRRLHSGDVRDYAAWLVVGLGAYGGLIALAVRGAK